MELEREKLGDHIVIRRQKQFRTWFSRLLLVGPQINCGIRSQAQAQTVNSQEMPIFQHVVFGVAGSGSLAPKPSLSSLQKYSLPSIWKKFCILATQFWHQKWMGHPPLYGSIREILGFFFFFFFFFFHLSILVVITCAWTHWSPNNWWIKHPQKTGLF